MNYYEILGIEKSATREEIKKSYLKLATTKHPDKGGDQAEFQQILEAYDVLYDETKRAHYDKTGTVPKESDEREKINSRLSKLLLEVIDSAPDSDYLEEMRLAINQKTFVYADLIEKGGALVAKHRKALNRVVRKDGNDNLFIHAIQSEIDNINNSIKKGFEQIEFNNKLLKELDCYMMVSNELTNIPSATLAA